MGAVAGRRRASVPGMTQRPAAPGGPALSHGAPSRRAWDCFFNLDKALFQHTKSCRVVDEELLAAQNTVAAGEDGVVERL